MTQEEPAQHRLVSVQWPYGPEQLHASPVQLPLQHSPPSAPPVLAQRPEETVGCRQQVLSMQVIVVS